MGIDTTASSSKQTPAHLCFPPSVIPAPRTNTSYNVIFFVVVGNVLPEGADDDHAENT